jgi:hypothetical protein
MWCTRCIGRVTRTLQKAVTAAWRFPAPNSINNRRKATPMEVRCRELAEGRGQEGEGQRKAAGEASKARARAVQQRMQPVELERESAALLLPHARCNMWCGCQVHECRGAGRGVWGKRRRHQGQWHGAVATPTKPMYGAKQTGSSLHRSLPPASRARCSPPGGLCQRRRAGATLQGRAGGSLQTLGCSRCLDAPGWTARWTRPRPPSRGG